MTRKQNNSTEHSKKMRSMNHKNHMHRDEVVEAINEDTGEVRHFANGKQCAESIGCSSPAVYMALDRAKANKKATIKGWAVRWIKDFEEDDIQNMKHERNVVSRTLRNGKFDRRIKILESYVKHIEESIEKREITASMISDNCKRKNRTLMCIERLKSKKKHFESQIAELVALKFKYANENGNIIPENNNGDNK